MDLSQIHCVLETRDASQVNRFLETGWVLIGYNNDTGNYSLGWPDGEPVYPKWPDYGNSEDYL